MGLGKKIIDFIAPPIKQKVPKQEAITDTEQKTQKKKPKIGVQNIEEIEYEILESNINTSQENITEIPELEVEEHTAQKQTYSETEKTQKNSSETFFYQEEVQPITEIEFSAVEKENNPDIKADNVQQEVETIENTLSDKSNISDSLSYQEYEQITNDIEELTTQETKNNLDIEVENITSQYTIAEIEISLSEEKNQFTDISENLYNVQLFDTSPVYAENQSIVPELFENAIFENAALTYFENTLIEENADLNKFTFSPLEELSQNKKTKTQQYDIEGVTHQKNLSHQKFIFSDNKKSITLPIHTSMQTELSSPIDYQPTDIQKITESISLEAPAMNALLKNAVRTIMQRKGIQEITPETLPLIKDDLSLVLEASGSNLSTMVGDVLQIKKIVNDKVNERRDKINEYKNELTQKITQLLTEVRHLEGEVGKLDNIIYTDIEELTKINKTLDTYQMLLASISEQKFNFE